MPTQQTSVELTLNYNAVRKLLWDLGEEGLNEALEVMLKRARKHAPVRDVFKSTSNKRPEAVPRIRQDSIGRMVNRRYNTPQRQDKFLSQVRSQSPKQRRSFGGGKGSSMGSSRAMEPTLGPRGDRDSGPFRRSSISDTGRVGFKDITTTRSEGGRKVASGASHYKGSELSKAQRTVDFMRKQGKMSVSDIRREFSNASQSVRRKENMARVKVGLKPTVPSRQDSAKAHILRRTALHVSASGEMTMGGRLRDEIYKTPITKRSNNMYGEVVSPTEYAKYQEYGTSHHRAQPFMRPALYEMRTRFPTIVKRALRKGSARKRVA